MAMTRQMTVADYERLSDIYERHELRNGELHVVTPPGEDHSDTAREIIWVFEQFIRSKGMEKLFIETAFVLGRDPGAALIPDVAFVRADRLDPQRNTSRPVQTHPDLAVEVVSPTDRPGEMDEKVRTYLDAGVEVVLLVDPRRRDVTAAHRNGSRNVLTGSDVLNLDAILPGFEVQVSRFFTR